MVISCIGDSLTEGDYGLKGKRCIPNVHAENYPYFLQQLTGAQVRNFGKCGFTAANFLKYYQSGAVDVTGSDYIIVILGTNGGFDPNAETESNSAFEILLQQMQAAAPKAKIVLCTPPHCTENPVYSNCGYMPRVLQAVEFIRRFAAQKGYPVIDLFARSEFTAETEAQMQPNDGLHFGELGYRTLAEIIFQALKTLSFKS